MSVSVKKSYEKVAFCEQATPFGHLEARAFVN